MDWAIYFIPPLHGKTELMMMTKWTIYYVRATDSSVRSFCIMQSDGHVMVSAFINDLTIASIKASPDFKQNLVEFCVRGGGGGGGYSFDKFCYWKLNVCNTVITRAWKRTTFEKPRTNVIIVRTPMFFELMVHIYCLDLTVHFSFKHSRWLTCIFIMAPAWRATQLPALRCKDIIWTYAD